MDGFVIPNGVAANLYLSQEAPATADPIFLKSIFPTSSIVVTNASQPGSALGLNVSGQDATLPAIEAKTANDTNIFSIANWGINNAYWITQGTESEAQFESDLTAYVQMQRSYGKTPILEEPNPICSDAQVSAVLDDIVVIIDRVSVSQSVPLVSQYQYIKSMPNWQAMLSDCIHPYDALYNIKSQREAYVIAGLAA
jgi:hypothetical protein